MKNRFPDPDSENDGGEPLIEDADSENEIDFYHQRSTESKGEQTFE
jgi:hypothetical protein